MCKYLHKSLQKKKKGRWENSDGKQKEESILTEASREATWKKLHSSSILND